MGRKVEVVTTVVFIFAQLPASAAAQDMPRYNPVDYCQRVADVSGGSSVLYNACIDME